MKNNVDEIINHEDVVLFIKGTDKYPMCECTERIVVTLRQAGMPFTQINLLAEPVIRANLPAFSNSSTFPQLFIFGQFFGGAAIVEDLAKSGELAKLVADVKQGRSV